MEHVIFIWDGPPINYIQVCLESLRLYNKNCIVNFFYTDQMIVEEYNKYNINFIKINIKNWTNRRLHHKLELTKKILSESDKDSSLLVLDCDLLFQNDPFLMFKEYPDNDFYYSTCIMSTKDSLRPDKLWKDMEYTINGGVKGYRHTENTIRFLNFWIDNNLNLTWEPWKNYKHRHKNNGVDWWYCQDFPNCINNNDLPFELKKVNVGYKYNYYVSTWGHFNEKLNMGNKIGNNEFVIIHFKDNFKDTYNIKDPNIYNMKNILEKKDLTTEQSRKNIYNKFLSRGERRWHIV
jgi:hypothetical protein